jgi:hypothetical protein
MPSFFRQCALQLANAPVPDSEYILAEKSTSARIYKLRLMAGKRIKQGDVVARVVFMNVPW